MAATPDAEMTTMALEAGNLTENFETIDENSKIVILFNSVFIM
jgi:hypothetical protein